MSELDYINVIEAKGQLVIICMLHMKLGVRPAMQLTEVLSLLGCQHTQLGHTGPM